MRCRTVDGKIVLRMRITLARAGRTGIIAVLQNFLLFGANERKNSSQKKKYYSGNSTTEFKENAPLKRPLTSQRLSLSGADQPVLTRAGVNKMAALKSLNVMTTACARTGFLAFPQTAVFTVRCASKKAGGSSKNLGGKSPGRRYGWKKGDGDFVHTGNILATQRLIRWHPGANVGMGRNKTLFALEDGTVRYTKEVYVPPPSSLETMKIISHLPKGAVLYKTFINVVPTKEEGCFKLVDML